MNQNVSLERSQCDKFKKNQLPPYFNLCIYERKCGSKVENDNGKNQSKLHILCSQANLKKIILAFGK